MPDCCPQSTFRPVGGQLARLQAGAELQRSSCQVSLSFAPFALCVGALWVAHTEAAGREARPHLGLAVRGQPRAATAPSGRPRPRSRHVVGRPLLADLAVVLDAVDIDRVPGNRSRPMHRSFSSATSTSVPLDRLPRPANPLLLAWAYNNYWDTKYPRIHSSRIRLRYGLLPLDPHPDFAGSAPTPAASHRRL